MSGDRRSMRPGPRDANSRGADRAQTTIDFAIGVGLFLVVVAFVVAFVPGMFVAYEGSADPAAADRGASMLSSDLLGAPDRGNAADPYCTAELFAQLDGADRLHDDAYEEGCRFDTTAGTAAELLALGYTVNVSVERRDGTVVEMTAEHDSHWLPQGHTVSEGETRTVRLAAGPSSEGRDDSVARRIVHLDTGDGATTHRVIVRVW